jgi:hypothetical protein
VDSWYKRLGYGVDGRGVGVQFPVEASDFSLHHNVQIGCGAHPASYTMGTGAISPEVKWQGHGVHSPPSSADITNSGPIHPLPHTFSGRGA